MQMRSKKQLDYFSEVIRLRYVQGYGPKRISSILPIGHATVSRWIAIFAEKNKDKAIQMPRSKSPILPSPSTKAVNDIASLQAEISRLEFQLKQERLRADAYDEMINVAESKFKVSIRKKVGAKR